MMGDNESSSGPEDPLPLGMPSWVFEVPNEVLHLIADNLPNGDVRSLIVSCKRFASSLQPYLLRRDISSKTYDSLAWACCFGDAKLAEACMLSGASPNVGFCHVEDLYEWVSPTTSLASDAGDSRSEAESEPGSDTKSIEKLVDELWNNPPDTSQRQDLAFHHFKYPVFPEQASIRAFGVNMLSGSQSVRNKSYSALTLATKYNCLDVIKVLLEAGASTLDEHHALPPSSTDSADGEEGHPCWYTHPSVISHVRSVAAAKMLLKAGADNYINVGTRTGIAPLETILYRCTQFRKEEKLDMTFSEIYRVIKLLIHHGASPRTVSARPPLAPYAGNLSLQSSPLVAAMGLKSLDTFNLVLQSGPQPLNPEIPECETVMLLALGLKNTDDIIPWVFDNPDFQIKALKSMLAAGLSPSYRINSQKSILTSVLEKGNGRALAALLEHQADLSTLGTRELCAVSESVLVRGLSTPRTSSFVAEVVQLGGDINQPSFGPDGLTPLAYAAAGIVSPDIFYLLLSHGARRTGFYRLMPGMERVSIMQCLLTGRPGLAPKGSTITIGHSTLPIFEPGMGSRSWQTQQLSQRAKFDRFLQCPDYKQLFRLSDGSHILKWVLKAFRGPYLTCPLNSVLAYYTRTKLPQDDEQEPPLMGVFDEAERMGYLAFGTLGHLPNLVWALLNQIEPKVNMKYNGETVLHRLCKLNPGCNDRVHWNRIIANESAQGNYFGYDARFYESVGSNWAYGDPGLITFEDLIGFHELYCAKRTASILATLRMLEA